MVRTFDKICYYQWQVQQAPDKQQVPDKWSDASKLPKFIKFGFWLCIVAIRLTFDCALQPAG